MDVSDYQTMNSLFFTYITHIFTVIWPRPPTPVKKTKQKKPQTILKNNIHLFFSFKRQGMITHVSEFSNKCNQIHMQSFKKLLILTLISLSLMSYVKNLGLDSLN